MSIKFIFLSYACSSDDEQVEIQSSFEHDTGENCYDWLDFSLVRLGLRDGSIFVSSDGEQLKTMVSFETAARLHETQVEALVNVLAGQLDDGVGEMGFEIEVDGEIVRVFADTSTRPVIEQGDPNGRPVSSILIDAHDGNYEGVKRSLESGDILDEMLQGYNALHLAILSGHSDVAKLILGNGTLTGQKDKHGDTALELCALTNSLSDVDAAGIVEEMAGVVFDKSEVENAIGFALGRGKTRLAEVIRRRFT